jgi:hypothetical protein
VDSLSTISLIFEKYNRVLGDHREENKLCLIKCTDKLNSPSEELTCYEKCEERYFNKLANMKELIYNDIDKILK